MWYGNETTKDSDNLKKKENKQRETKKIFQGDLQNQKLYHRSRWDEGSHFKVSFSVMERSLEVFYTVEVLRYIGLGEGGRLSGGQFTPRFSPQNCLDFKDLF